MEVLTGYPAAEAIGRHSSLLNPECGLVFGSAEAPLGPRDGHPSAWRNAASNARMADKCPC